MQNIFTKCLFEKRFTLKYNLIKMVGVERVLVNFPKMSKHDFTAIENVNVSYY